MADLLDRHLLFVTGKGGAGKSTVTAALAMAAARTGKRVLVCEVNAAQERIAPLLGAASGGPRDPDSSAEPRRRGARPREGGSPREVLPGIHVLDVLPRDAMREYGLMVLRYRPVYEAVFENRLARYFLRVIPSLSELVVLGKILHEARAVRPDGAPRWDLVLVDAPATGHAVQLLRVPSVLLDAAPAGPLRHDAEWMQRLLVDPVQTAVVLVTLPEDMPVNEAIELDAQVRGVLGMARAGLVVNAMPASRISGAEALALHRVAGAPPPLGPAARAAELAALRVEEARRHLARARGAIDLPTIVLPLVPSIAWGPNQIGALARIVAAEPGSRPAAVARSDPSWGTA